MRPVEALPVDMDVVTKGQDKGCSSSSTKDAMRVNQPAVDNGDGTYIVRYNINNGELPSAYPKIRVKIDDGTMFNDKSVFLYKQNNNEMRDYHRNHHMEEDYNEPYMDRI